MKKRLVCVTLALLISASQVLTVSASREDELREEQAYTNDALNETYATLDSLQSQKDALEAEISTLDQNLVNVCVNIEALKQDIANKTSDIEQTQKDLTKAENARDQQYDSMKLRIQYLYEKGGDDAWLQMMLNGESLSQLLERAEYTQKMYDYDRQNLDKYVETVENVTNLKTQYENEKSEMVEMEGDYEQQQANLQAQIEEKQAVSANYSEEIAYAQQQAEEYVALIQQQQAEIEQLEAERIAAEEEARRQAEAEAAAAAAAAEAEAAAQEEAEESESSEETTDETTEEETSDNPYDHEYIQYDENGNIITNENGEAIDADGDVIYDENGQPIIPGGSSSSQDDTEDSYEDSEESEDTSEDSSEDVQYDEYGNVIDSENTVTDTEDSSSDSTPSYSGTGSSVADYATQFVGNPYVYGGTSLTNGADCSGFVQSVYANFGVSLPRTSEEQMYAGTEVSYADAQPGDLICYGSHIAIYLGNGQIVHASNSAPYPQGGIKISDNAAYRTILSVRRVI